MLTHWHLDDLASVCVFCQYPWKKILCIRLFLLCQMSCFMFNNKSRKSKNEIKTLPIGTINVTEGRTLCLRILGSALSYFLSSHLTSDLWTQKTACCNFSCLFRGVTLMYVTSFSSISYYSKELQGKWGKYKVNRGEVECAIILMANELI